MVKMIYMWIKRVLFGKTEQYRPGRMSPIRKWWAKNLLWHGALTALMRLEQIEIIDRVHAEIKPIQYRRISDWRNDEGGWYRWYNGVKEYVNV